SVDFSRHEFKRSADIAQTAANARNFQALWRRQANPVSSYKIVGTLFSKSIRNRWAKPFA
ncbi:MAG: hypothetical protein ACXW6J_28220, partial [Candidatus Binatia bacterium]